MPDYRRGKAAARGHALATNIQRQSSAPFQTVSRLKPVTDALAPVNLTLRLWN
jgi:hypothetical protein